MMQINQMKLRTKMFVLLIGVSTLIYVSVFSYLIISMKKETIREAKELVSKAINDLRDLAKSMHGEKIAEIG